MGLGIFKNNVGNGTIVDKKSATTWLKVSGNSWFVANVQDSQEIIKWLNKVSLKCNSANLIIDAFWAQFVEALFTLFDWTHEQLLSNSSDQKFSPSGSIRSIHSSKTPVWLLPTVSVRSRFTWIFQLDLVSSSSVLWCIVGGQIGLETYK